MSLFRTKITVNAHERAAEYVDGSLTRVLAPGRYRQPRRATYVRVHVLESIQQLAAQDVLSSDGVSVRVTAASAWRSPTASGTSAVRRTRTASSTWRSRSRCATRWSTVEVDALVRSPPSPVTLSEAARRAGAPARPRRASRSWSRT